jgi:1-deoxy-D-xylulose-5-phosphate synthase
MADNGYTAEIRRLGIPDYFVEQGTQEELIRECGFDPEGIEKVILEMAGTNVQWFNGSKVQRQNKSV